MQDKTFGVLRFFQIIGAFVSPTHLRVYLQGLYISDSKNDVCEGKILHMSCDFSLLV